MCIRTKIFSHARPNFGKRYGMEMSFLLICRKRIVESTFKSVLRYADVIYWRAAASTLWLCLPPLRFITEASAPATLSFMIRSVGPLRLRSAVSVVSIKVIGKPPSNITSMLHWKPGPLLTRSGVPAVTSSSKASSQDWSLLQQSHAVSFKEA